MPKPPDATVPSLSPASPSYLWAIATLLRAKQWMKNGLVFAALVFSGRLVHKPSVLLALITFVGFCLASSAAYCLNDALDASRDRLHPKKRSRPVASGLISRVQALALSALLAVAGLSLGFNVGYSVGLILLLYLVVNVSYSLALKHTVLIDIMAVASGYVLRAIGGAEAIGVELSLWFLLVVPLLSLFLAAAKRRHELAVTEQPAAHRAVLTDYSTKLLDQLLAILGGSVIMGYFLYSMESTRAPRVFMLTGPLVVYGVFRYLYLVYNHDEGGDPDELLVSDPPLLVTVVLWILAVCGILYLL